MRRRRLPLQSSGSDQSSKSNSNPTDSDDTTAAQFIIGASGVTAAFSIDINDASPTAKTGNPEYKSVYAADYLMSPASYLSYVNARKDHRVIASVNQINQSGIYVYDADLTLNSVPAQFNSYDVVLITDGTVNINMADFNPSRSIAILANTINFSATTTQAQGLFIADSITSGVANFGLKIIGDLSTGDGA